MGIRLNTIKSRLPAPIIALTCIISGIGILNLASAAQALRPNLYLFQLLGLFCGFIIAGVIICIPTRFIRLIAYPLFLAVIFLLVLVLAIGTPVKGAQRWIDLGFFNIQPSEFAKISVMLATARYCSDYGPYKGFRLRDLIGPFYITRPLFFSCCAFFIFLTQRGQDRFQITRYLPEEKVEMIGHILLLMGVFWLLICIWQLQKKEWSLSTFVCLGDIVLLPFLLILIEPDLGTSLIALAIPGTMILFYGVRQISLLIAFVLVVLMAIFAWNVVLKDYQKHRIEVFLNPHSDLRGEGYHAAQSMIAVGSGQLLGKGFGEGTQTQLSFLPENHTDFVFSVFAEEWGFFGTVSLLMLFLALILMLLKTGLKAEEDFNVLLSIGSTSIVFWHVFINVSMVTGLLPVVGVPLPLMSYGRSFMFTQLSAIALAINSVIWRKAK